MKEEQLMLVDPLSTRKNIVGRAFLTKLLECHPSIITNSRNNVSYNKKIRCYIVPGDTSTNDVSKIISNHKFKHEAWFTSSCMDDSYKVSSYGRVARFFKNGNMKILQGYKKKGRKSSPVYVKTKKDGKQVEISVSRIAATTLLNNNEPLEDKRVIHKDRNRWNNTPGNLEIVNQKELAKFAHLASSIRVAKISPWDNKIVAVYKSCAEAGRENGLSKETIRLGVKSKGKEIYRSHSWIKISDKRYEEFKEKLFECPEGIKNPFKLYI